MELYPYKSSAGQMEPVALIGHNVCIHYVSDLKYRRVTWLEAIPPFQFLDIGALAAQATSARTQARNLENFAGEFSQFRWWPEDDVQIRFFLPQTNGKQSLRNIQTPVDRLILTQDPDLHMTEIFIWEDRVPWFEAVNATDYALAAVRLRGMGFRYVSRELTASEVKRVEQMVDPCVHLPACGWQGSTK